MYKAAVVQYMASMLQLWDGIMMLKMQHVMSEPILITKIDKEASVNLKQNCA
jgi:hypothetical protein